MQCDRQWFKVNLRSKVKFQRQQFYEVQIINTSQRKKILKTSDLLQLSLRQSRIQAAASPLGLCFAHLLFKMNEI